MSDNKNLDLAEIYEMCAEELATKGWVQGSMWGPMGSRCAFMVIVDCANTKTEASVPSVDILGTFTNHLSRSESEFRRNVSPHPIVVWNDEPGRTKEEVIDAFIGCAKELRNKG